MSEALQPYRQPINFNWSVDTSAGKFLKFTSGVITAALSDNVQVLAIEACLKYGAQLAMCDMVCLRMQKLGQRKKTWPVLRNIGVQIGFAPGDTADCFSSSKAGRR